MEAKDSDLAIQWTEVATLLNRTVSSVKRKWQRLRLHNGGNVINSGDGDGDWLEDNDENLREDISGGGYVISGRFLTEIVCTGTSSLTEIFCTGTFLLTGYFALPY
jgi:hypothetical protein